MSDPVVTIALPIYNSAEYLEACLTSIKQQTFENFEVVAVLDGCTDSSEAILEQHKDSRFRVLVKKANEGHVAALNTIHGLARGEFVARCDSDDDYEPTRIEKQVEFFRANPSTDVLGTRFDYIDRIGKPTRAARNFPLSHNRIRRDFQRYTAIGGPTCMYRLQRIRAVGDYNQRFNHVEDLALWLACLAAGHRFANLPDVLVHYRVHESQASQRNSRRQLPQLHELYELYGPKIWGDEAKPFGVHEGKWKRLKRKFTDLLLPDR